MNVEIPDISLAAFLDCCGYKYKIRKDKEKDTKSLFVFEPSGELDKAIENYYNHEARVDPLQFSESLRNLKSHSRLR
jgi:hypothetical protein